MRLNPRAFEKTLLTDGSLTYFWHYNPSFTVEFNATTQEPALTDSGTVVSTYADVLDFTINEIKNLGGIVTQDSKKFIVNLDETIEKGDEVINVSMLELYKIVFVVKFANRKHLYANKVTEGAIQHVLSGD